MGEFLEYADVLQEVRGAMNPGRLKLQKSNIVFKNIKTGILETLQSSDVEEATWLIRARGHCLKLLLATGNVHRFDGLKESDYDKLKAFIKTNYNVSLKKKDVAIKGWNWGVANFVGNALEFEVDKQPAFDIPLNYVSHSVTSKNEVTLEFHLNDDAAVSLSELRFHIPTDPANPESDPVNEFYQNVLGKADIIQATGDAFATFTEVQCLTPRGRYDIKIYQSFMQLHGKTFDYKIPYTTILRLFLLPHRDNRQMFFVVSVDPPIKQGQTRYHFLILLFNKEYETKLELELSEKDLEEKYEGKLTKSMAGPEYEIISRVMKILVNRKITVPGTFVGHSDAQSVACSYKAATGFLYPLERGFIFVHKPPIHIRFDEVSNVNFARSSGSNRSFDFEVDTKTGSAYTFVGIEKEEYGKLYDFVKHKKLRVKNIGDKLNKKGATYDDMMGSDDEGHHDAYLERMKAEGQERDDDDDDDEGSSEDEDFNPDAVVSEPDDEFDSNPETTDSEAGEGEGDGEKSPEKKKKKKKSRTVSEAPRQKRGGKKEVDPTKPKRPMTAYFLWLNATRESIKKDNPGIAITELSKKAGEMWRTIRDKTEWEKKSAIEKKNYEKAMQEWEASDRPIPTTSTTSRSPKKSRKRAPKGSPAKDVERAFKSQEFIEDSDSDSDDSDKPLKSDKKSKEKPSKRKPQKEASESEDDKPLKKVGKDGGKKREKRQPKKSGEEEEEMDVDDHAGLPSDESEAEMTDGSEGSGKDSESGSEEEASGSGSEEESD